MTHADARAPSDRPGRVRVGIVGASPRGGWAAMAHVPAIRAVPSLTLHAVATRSAETARAAAEAFGAPLWFDDAGAMIEHAEVDAVVVAVKAPDHYGLVKRALLAGKPVYCEMPFGHTIGEARELEGMARERGLATAVGLQGRFSPWVRQVREVVGSGRLGRVLSTSLVAYDEFSMGSVDQGNAYLLDVANGANPLTVHSAHYVDALCFALGELTAVSAVTATSRPRAVVRQTGETIAATSPDQVAFCGLLDGGALASFHMRAGTGDPSFLWEVQGEDAVLRVTSQGYLMWRPLRLELWDAAPKRWDDVLPPEAPERWKGVPTPEGPAQNVAYALAALAEDVLTGSTRSVSFSDALARRETMEAIRAAAHDGAARFPSAITRGGP